MHQLLPMPLDDVDAATLYRSDEHPTLADRPWVTLNMVTSIDGATAMGGVSGELGGPADKAVFGAVRTTTDVVLVGAGTVRAEDYGPARTKVADQQARLARDQQAHPRLAVVSGRLDLDPAARLFSDPDQRPIVFTRPEAPAERRKALESVAEVVALDPAADTATAMVAWLHAQGARSVVCEGGPTLNGQLIAAGLVDEVYLTLAPVLASGESSRFAHGPSPAVPAALRLVRVLADDGVLFLRYQR